MLSAHRAAVIKATTEGLGIQFVFISQGCTNTLQPLDRRFFGFLKALARQLWRTQYYAMHGAKIAHVQMVENLIVSWDRITPDLTDRAWNRFEGEWEELASAESKGSQGEFHPQVIRHELQDLV
jgi:hypothetical protein